MLNLKSTFESVKGDVNSAKKTKTTIGQKEQLMHLSSEAAGREG